MFGRQRRARRKRLEALEDLRRPVELHEVLDSGAWPYAPERRHRRTWVRRLPLVVTLLLTTAFVAGFIAFHPGQDARRVRHLLGFGPDRLLPAPELPADTGSFAFVLHQPDGSGPVGYDPCKLIEVEINPDGAPERHREFVDTSIERISAATGLAFDVIGTTDRVPDLEDPPTTRGPSLVAWTTEDVEARLAGDVAGYGGSTAVTGPSGRRYFVTGQVVLDADVFANPSITNRQFQSIVDHEFAHLVGLSHVDDRNELMHPSSSDTDRFGPGDLRGLAELGRVPCE